MAQTSSSERSEADRDTVPEAEVIPRKDGASDPDAVDVKIYIVTGKHGIFTIPESFCRECDLFVRSADVAAERVDVPVNVRVFSWWSRFLGALRYGGYHPPVMVVGGERLCQGHTVPSIGEVAAAIEEAAGR